MLTASSSFFNDCKSGGLKSELERFFQKEAWLDLRALSAVLCLTCQRVWSSDRAADSSGGGGDWKAERGRYDITILISFKLL